MRQKRKTINVNGSNIAIVTHNEDDFISLTDMVRNFYGGSALIENWLKNKDTVLFLGVWEQINNIDFNSPEFEGIKTWLNQIAITQLKSLTKNPHTKKLSDASK